MTIINPRIFFFLLFLTNVCMPVMYAQERYVPGQFLVSLSADITPIDWIQHQQDQSVKWVVEKQISKVSANIWLLSTAATGSEQITATNWLKSQKGVEQVQLNHYVQQRQTHQRSPDITPSITDQPLYATLPNDPGLGAQWYLKNTGQNGGTTGVDLGMENAWDITKGGISPTGDTVVVAIIDGGLCTYCEDWGNNLWVNHQETPNDGIDNDANGYFDDYNGWNVNAQNDNISGFSTGHGTPVAGIIAAKGDNNRGISGIMWNTKLLFVAGLSGTNTTESEVLAAYEYVYAARKTYNDTHGQFGAFIVAVNCSFGINFGTPSQSPLWCSMLDQLGEVGILTVAATANGNWEVDEVGDIPTTCPSDYLISVTSVNNTDKKVENAAWGIKSVDIAAFGKDIYSSQPGSPGYGYYSGTSFAAPQVSGAVGLLYTAPCKNLSALAKQSPAAAAFWAKKIILESVQPNPTLAGITVSGGRLQADAMLNHYQNQCLACPAPYWLSNLKKDTVSALLSWVESAEFMSVDLRWRADSAANWVYINNVQPPYLLNGLLPCVGYQFSLRAHCDSTNISEWSNTSAFKTDGCCTTPVIQQVTTSLGSSAFVTWTPITAAKAYYIRYRSANTTNWTYINNLALPQYNLTGLMPCTEYEIQLKSKCTSGLTDFSVSHFFQTDGCGACYDMNYCMAQSQNAIEEWIAELSIGNDWVMASSGNQGYQSFVNAPDVKDLYLYPNTQTTATITPGFASSPYLEMFRIYVDFNLDGIFNNSTELVFDPAYAHNGAITSVFSTPAFGSSGITRMRVMMKYKSPNYLDLPLPCESFAYGQVEDYCVHLEQPTLDADLYDDTRSTTIEWSPNPVKDHIQVQIKSSQAFSLGQATIYNLTGQLLHQQQLAGKDDYFMITNLQFLPAGIYILEFTSPELGPIRYKMVKN